ncbi:hypothetical protein C6P40_004723, partial [Pichia californica]
TSTSTTSSNSSNAIISTSDNRTNNSNVLSGSSTNSIQSNNNNDHQHHQHVSPIFNSSSNILIPDSTANSKSDGTLAPRSHFVILSITNETFPPNKIQTSYTNFNSTNDTT